VVVGLVGVAFPHGKPEVNVTFSYDIKVYKSLRDIVFGKLSRNKVYP